jgi:hypothetical protein
LKNGEGVVTKTTSWSSPEYSQLIFTNMLVVLERNDSTEDQPACLDVTKIENEVYMVVLEGTHSLEQYIRNKTDVLQCITTWMSGLEASTFVQWHRKIHEKDNRSFFV